MTWSPAPLARSEAIIVRYPDPPPGEETAARVATS